MTITQTRAHNGLIATVTPTSPTSAGSLSIGIPSGSTNLALVDTFYSVQALIVGAGSSAVVELNTGAKTGSTAWTAGSAQVETATAAGNITTAGNATITVTSAGMTNSPKAISVAVALNDTPTMWADKVRTTLTADVNVSERFTVGGANTSISLTRKPLATYTVGSVSVPTYPATDSTLNIAIANGTCAGITANTTSANTTAGALSVGAYVVGDGEDFEGNSFTAIGTNKIAGVYVSNSSVSPGNVLVSSTYMGVTIPVGGSLQSISASSNLLNDTLTITPASTSLVTVVVAGKA